MKLEIGYNNHFEIRKEYVFANCKNFTILFLSDLHFIKFTKNIHTKIIQTIRELNPDIILLGGDYVDTKRGLIWMEDLLKEFSQRKNVFAIAGNHDYYFGIDKIKMLMTSYNVQWIEKSSIKFKLNDTNICIDGNNPQAEKNNSDLSILCIHKPIDINPYKENYQLVLAGHLHGCQFVFWQNEKGLYPGKIFFKWNFLRSKIGDCLYLISKGLGDTLPVRYNCKKDMLLIEVGMNNNS